MKAAELGYGDIIEAMISEHKGGRVHLLLDEESKVRMSL